MHNEPAAIETVLFQADNAKLHKEHTILEVMFKPSSPRYF